MPGKKGCGSKGMSRAVKSGMKMGKTKDQARASAKSKRSKK